MKPRGVVLGIGRLLRLEVLDPRTGRSRVYTPRGKWLTWDTGKKCYRIATIVKHGLGGAEVGTGQHLPPAIQQAHRRFHDKKPDGGLLIDAPNPSGRLRQVGLLKALVYDTPRAKIRSPSKNKYQWHHAFGDTGHEGRTDYPTKVMPAVLKDAKGNWFIRRRPGNIFTVDTWLRG